MTKTKRDCVCKKSQTRVRELLRTECHQMPDSRHQTQKTDKRVHAGERKPQIATYTSLRGGKGKKKKRHELQQSQPLVWACCRWANQANVVASDGGLVWEVRPLPARSNPVIITASNLTIDVLWLSHLGRSSLLLLLLLLLAGAHGACFTPHASHPPPCLPKLM